MDKRQDTTFFVATQPSVWFRLVASHQADTNSPLHQISSSYIRVQNKNLKLSYLKKYIVTKLDLKSEDEVELYLENESLDSMMTLYDLLQYWIMRTKEEGDIINTQAGSSGADYVMVVNYGRKSEHIPQLTHLATTNEVAPVVNEAARFTEVLSTSQHVSSPSASKSVQKSSKGRLIKPTQKKQEMDQITAQRGRGNRGRGGRGGRG